MTGRSPQVLPSTSTRTRGVRPAAGRADAAGSARAGWAGLRWSRRITSASTPPPRRNTLSPTAKIQAPSSRPPACEGILPVPSAIDPRQEVHRAGREISQGMFCPKPADHLVRGPVLHGHHEEASTQARSAINRAWLVRTASRPAPFNTARSVSAALGARPEPDHCRSRIRRGQAPQGSGPSPGCQLDQASFTSP